MDDQNTPKPETQPQNPPPSEGPPPPPPDRFIKEDEMPPELRPARR